MSFEAAASLAPLYRSREQARFSRLNVRVMDPLAAAKTVARQIADLARTGHGTALTPGCNTPLQMYKQLFLEGGIELPRQLAAEQPGGFSLGMIDGIEWQLEDKLSFPHYFIESFLRFNTWAPVRSVADPVQRKAMIEKVYAFYRQVFVPHIDSAASPAEKVTAVELFHNWLAARMPIDLIVCGLGPDGHLAFLGPGTQLDRTGPLAERVKLWPGIQAWKWLEESDDACKCAMTGSCEIGPRRAPEYALTISLRTLLSAKRIILMAQGEGKAEAVARLIKGPLAPADFTAHYLGLVSDRVTVLLDSDAARRL